MSDATARPAGPDPTPDPHAVQVVDGDWACIACSYPLKGLSVAGKCPECGTPVADTPRLSPLRAAPIDSVRTLLGGVAMLLDGLILMILFPLAGLIVLILVGPLPSVMGLLSLGFTLIATVLVLLGSWRYAAKAPGATDDDPASEARARVRLSVGLLIGWAVLLFVQPLLWPDRPEDDLPSTSDWLATITVLALIVAGVMVWAFHTWAVMLYTAVLAQRIPDDAILRRARLYARLLPVLYFPGVFVLVGPLVALLMYGALLERVRRRLNAIVDAGAPAKAEGGPG